MTPEEAIKQAGSKGKWNVKKHIAVNAMEIYAQAKLEEKIDLQDLKRRCEINFRNRGQDFAYNITDIFCWMRQEPEFEDPIERKKRLEYLGSDQYRKDFEKAAREVIEAQKGGTPSCIW